MHPAEFPVRRPISTVMLLVGVLVLGAIAFMRIPLAYLPAVDVPFIHVSIPRPNQSPTQNEKEMAKPVEEVLATLPGVAKLSSRSQADSVEFDLEFKWGQDLDLVRMAVREKLDRVAPSLPEDRGQIQMFSFNTGDMPVVRGRISAPNVDLSASYGLLESRIVNRLQRVDGVARVELDGVEPRVLYIDLVIDAVARHGIDIGQLIDRLQGNGRRLVLGEVLDGRRRLKLRAAGALTSLEAVKNFVVAPGVSLADIAEVRLEEPPIAYGRILNREPAIALRVSKESTANTVEVVRAVMKVLEVDVAADPALAGIKVFVWEDQAEQITAGVSGLQKAGIVGSILAVVTLYGFLRRLAATLIVSLSIPCSVVATFGVLFLSGHTLNMLSMMGLMLGVGMLVDNAIVVLESIERCQSEYADRREAAIAGGRQVAVAVLAATTTTLIVFLPLVLGSKSELSTWLREVGITISLSLLCSLFASLTLIPLLAAHVMPKHKVQAKPRAFSGVEALYGRVLAWTLVHRWKTKLIAVLAVMAGIAPLILGGVESAMFSANVHKRMFIQYDFADFHYKSDAKKVVEQVEAELYKVQDEHPIESLYSWYAENEAATTINLSRFDLEDEQVKDLREKLRPLIPEVPGVRIFFSDNAEEGGSQTQFEVKFFGRDAERLRTLTDQAQEIVRGLDKVRDVHSSFRRGRQEIEVRVDRQAAAKQGIDAKTVSDIIRFSLGGTRLPRFAADGREVDVWLALRIRDRQRLSDLRRLRIPAGDGRVVELGELVEFRRVQRSVAIEREHREVRAAVSATYEGEAWPETQAKITELMNEMTLPAGYHWSWDDRILEQSNQDAEMLINLVLALFLVYLVMASLFESFTQPLVMLSSILFALPGALWMLMVTGTPFNIMAQIGLLILMGIVVNNGVVLVDRYNQHRRGGLARDEALVQAGRDRMRAIMMTAATTIIGLAPLAIGGSAVGGLFYFPMARTVMGGLISSAVFTLLALPVLLVQVERVVNFFSSAWQRSRVLGGR